LPFTVFSADLVRLYRAEFSTHDSHDIDRFKEHEMEPSAQFALAVLTPLASVLVGAGLAHWGFMAREKSSRSIDVFMRASKSARDLRLAARRAKRARDERIGELESRSREVGDQIHKVENARLHAALILGRQADGLRQHLEELIDCARELTWPKDENRDQHSEQDDLELKIELIVKEIESIWATGSFARYHNC